MSCSAPWFKEPPLWERGRLRDALEKERMQRLHEEIMSFYEKTKPTQAENQRRERALCRVKQVITNLWPGAEVKVFGSFATGLYLPSTSDMDIAIEDPSSGSRSVQTRLSSLASALIRSGYARNVKVIARARIPIVKFVEELSAISFDVRLDPGMELQAVNFIASAMAQFPTLAPLYILIKSFLQVKHLNEVYPDGGLASYTLFVMLYTLLQVHPNGGDASYPSSAHSGFFHFYGKSLNVQQYGISCRPGCQHFFVKAQKGFLDSWKPYLLAVEDPLLNSNDIVDDNPLLFENV